MPKYFIRTLVKTWRMSNRIVEEFNLKEKVVLAVFDNAMNILSAIKTQFGWQHFDCYAHCLNLVVQSALNSAEMN